jgi:hypothetical protein
LPWVPQSVLDELLESQRALRGRLDIAPPAPAPSLESPAPRETVAPTPYVELPSVVQQACESYSFGSSEERAANYKLARDLHAVGKDAGTIVRAIRSGGRVPEVAF